MLLNGAAVLSALLFAVIVAVWVRSYWTAQYVGHVDAAGWVGALSMRGVVRVERGGYGGLSRPEWQYSAYSTPAGGLAGELAARDRNGGWLRSIGFAYARFDYTGDGRSVRRAWYAPHWAVAGCFGVPAALWAVGMWRQGRRRGPGVCARCGYDLRATPERCPECGAIPTDARRVA